MPRAYWKGHLRLSLVTCPIELFPAATQAENTHFHQINTRTGHRLRQQMVDEQTGQVVDAKHKGRGYELSKGHYVPIDEDELKAVAIESTHTIDITGFVPTTDIDKRYLDKPYYITPQGKVGADAFAVIRDAMKDKGRVALAKIVIAHREYVIALEPLGKGLLGTTLRYDYEVRDEKVYLSDIPSPRVSKDMIDLAAHILATKETRSGRERPIQASVPHQEMRRLGLLEVQLFLSRTVRIRGPAPGHGVLISALILIVVMHLG
jgi:Ku protein